MKRHFQYAAEIFRLEIEGLRGALGDLEESFDDAVELILATKGKVVVTGLGKSGIIGHKISATLASTGTPSVFVNAAEALHGDLGIISDTDTVVMVSKSGTTTELVRMLPTLKQSKAFIIGIFGNSRTSLARECDVVLNASVEREACPLNLSPMTSTTLALVIGDSLAGALIRAKGFTSERFAMNHPAGALGRNLLLRVRDVMHTGDALPRVCRIATFREVILVLTRTNLGGLCVLRSDGCLEGYISDGDIRRALLNADPLAMTAEDLMTASPVVCRENDLLGDIIAQMENPDRQIYAMPVVRENNSCVGIVRMHDILQANT